MSWSFTIARVAGTEVRMHVTFLILLAWIGIANYLAAGGAAAAEAVLFILAVFACVVLHELGHAVTAGYFGIKTADITLLPIGGLARLSRMPERSSEEIIIAIAGPLVNVVIALVLILWLGIPLDTGALLAALADPQAGFWVQLAAINLFLVLFNLIPAFPMDGGRVLRALLAIWLGRRRATDIAARIGQAVAFGFGFIGLMVGNAILVFVAIFVYIAASAEAGYTSLLEVARRAKIENAMIGAFETLAVGATADDAAKALLHTTQREFPVVDGAGRLRGVVTREGVVAAMKGEGPQTPVTEFMVKDIPVLKRTQRLDEAFHLLQEKNVPIVGVLDSDERFVGYVSSENIAELWMLESASWRGAWRTPTIPSLGGRPRGPEG